MLERTGLVQAGLRRYVNEHEGEHFHSALTLFPEHRPAVTDAEGYLQPAHWNVPYDDPRWPRTCGCGYAFTDEDVWQDWQDALWTDTRTGTLRVLRDAPPGATYDAWWQPWKGPDGRSIVVICPDGHSWTVDGVASNCTIHTGESRRILPYDPDPSSPPEAHRCWIRHGEPPVLTVDKAGHTCQAGGGSIQTPGYHGFLRNGVFDP